MSFRGLAIDAAGDVYVGNETSRIIYRAVPHGTATRFAGRPLVDGNVDATGAAAQFSLPRVPVWDAHFELATDAQGNVYVGETDRVRKVTPAGVVTTLPLPPGDISTRYYPSSEAVDGSVLVVSSGVISRVDAAGVSHFIAGQAGVAGVADGVGAKASFTNPTRLVEDAQGTIWLTDSVRGPMTDVGDKIYYRKITPDGTVTTLPAPPAGNADGILYRGKDGSQWGVDNATNDVIRIAPDGTRTVVRPARDINDHVVALTVDRNGNVFVAMREGSNLNSVRRITAAGTETVIAGTPGVVGVRPVAPGSLGPVDAIAVAPDGTVYVFSENTLIRILQ
jgi:hypothetical protein